MKHINFIFLLVFCIGLVSANGLTITSNNTLDLTKQENTDITFVFQISNTEPYQFYNITSDDDILEFGKFDLLSGETKNITATIKKNEDFSGVINIQGQYETTLGSSNITQIVTITQSGGADKCNLDLTKGDTITWISEDIDDLILRNAETDVNFATINQGQNFSRTFTEPLVLNYRGIWLGLPITNICRLEIQNDEGLVHSSEYDAQINLNLTINFQQTVMEKTFLQDNYEISFNEQKEDIFSIRNTGVNTARNIKLSGDWMSFDQNNFDLLPSQTKVIKFTINPIITSTNQTNKTYVKQINISGNFLNLIQDISVFVKYSNIDNIINGGEIDYEYWKQAYLLLCNNYKTNPTDELKEICEKNYYGGTGYNNSVEINEQVLWDFMEAMRTKEVNDIDWKKDLTETIKAEVDDKLNSTTISQNLTTQVNMLQEELAGQREADYVTWTIFFGGLIISLSLFNLDKIKRLYNARKSMGLEKGEID